MATPKAKLNQIYGFTDGQPRYVTFAGRPPEIGDCVTQPGQLCTFYCILELPNGTSVTSDACRRKKDAEHDAARKALHKIGTPFESEASVLGSIKSHDEVWVELKCRIETAFSNECVLNYKPLMEHFRAAIVRRGQSHAPVPASVLASLDSKIISLCKVLDKLSDSNPARAIELVCMAAKECTSLKCEANLWISRVEPYPASVKSGLLGQTPELVTVTTETQRVQFDAVYIPCTLSKMVSAIQINVESSEYYMDVLASKLGIEDGARVLISRSITKAPSSTRLFWGLSEELPSPEGNNVRNPRMNMRASTLTGYPVYGNAILAAVGSTWKSEGKLCCETVSLGCYHRLVLGKYPTGSYKLSRGAVLTAELPPVYTSKLRWRGPTPRALLNEFCHQSHLLAPTFCSYPVKGALNEQSSSEFEDHGCTSDAQDHAEISDCSEDLNSNQGPFMCKLKIAVGGSPWEFESERSYRNRNDAIQSACLRALLYFDDRSVADLLEGCGLQDEKGWFRKTLELQNANRGTDEARKLPDFEILRGADKAGDKPPIGSMVHVEYTARIKGDNIDGEVEMHKDFDFELGSGAVLGLLDTCIANMCVDQTARFCAPSPPIDLLLAAHEFSASAIKDFMYGRCSVEYTVCLLKVVEAPEARMESAVFSPPLSKQRIDFALQLFQRSQASSVVDLGCGSGSFLEAILEQPNNLRHIAGIDISQKSLTRASKSLQTRLLKLPNNSVLESATLYEGSIAEPVSHLRDFDVATCLEVVEHMDPEPLSKFGKSILGVMSPKILVVSTPNIEYNPILHGFVTKMRAPQEKVDKFDENSQTDDSQELQKADTDDIAAIKLRNDDHRFEWTRAEFCDWASDLACKYGYSVEFSGVGGSSDQEPGFASQIATFTRLEAALSAEKHGEEHISLSNGAAAKAVEASSYSQIWRWASPNS